MGSSHFTQGIFWNNFPVGKQEHLGQFEEEIKKTDLCKVDTPYIIFTGTTYIDFTFLIENQKLVEELRKTGLDIYLYEPVSLYVEGQEHTHDYYSEFHHKNNNSIRASELDCVEELVVRTKIPVTVYTCDYHPDELLQSVYTNFKVLCDDFFMKAHIQPFRPKVRKKIKKPFWCGNGRYAMHRHLVMCHLVDKPGNYSWFYTCRDMNGAFTNVDWTGSLINNKLEKKNKKLNKSHFFIDGMAEKLQIENASKFTLAKKKFLPNARFHKSYETCFCAVINETRFAQPVANVSEKMLNAVQAKTPFILVGPPRSLEYTRKLGFKTFSDFWDESYDLEENHEKRMLMIFDLIDSINKMSIEEMEEMYEQMKEIIEHNFNAHYALPNTAYNLPS